LVLLLCLVVADHIDLMVEAVGEVVVHKLFWEAVVLVVVDKPVPSD
jgi:hypothetical protein